MGFVLWTSKDLKLRRLPFHLTRLLQTRNKYGVFLSGLPLHPTKTHLKFVQEEFTGIVFPVMKRPDREADQLPTSGDEVKNAWSYTSILSIRLHGGVLN